MTGGRRKRGTDPAITLKRASAFLVPVFLAGPAVAQDSMELSGTIIRLQLSERPGAVAEVYFNNVDRNDTGDEVAFDLTIPGLTIFVTFDWEHLQNGSDAVQVTPPDGMSCLPTDCILPVQEGHADTLYLFDHLAVGM